MIKYGKPVVVIAGPTASGKSSIALQIAKKIKGYIINGDSRQVYKELKIGTAQPNPDFIKDGTWYIDGIKHHLYGHIPIINPYNLYQYQQDVQKVLIKEELIPILVGGTGLYIDSIVFNYDLSKKERQCITYSRHELEKLNIQELHSLIKPSVLKNFNNSDINNPIRLIRAIERGDVNNKKGEQLNHIYILVDRGTEELKGSIIQRVNQMFEDGLIEENSSLIERGFDYNMHPLQSIGYREFKGFFMGKKSLEKVKEDIIKHTIQYSKRQMTWFKRNENTVKIKTLEECYEQVGKFLSTS